MIRECVCLMLCFQSVSLCICVYRVHACVRVLYFMGITFIVIIKGFCLCMRVSFLCALFIIVCTFLCVLLTTRIHCNVHNCASLSLCTCACVCVSLCVCVFVRVCMYA